MPALTDNYTTPELTRPLVAEAMYKTDTEPFSASIVVAWNQQSGLNNRIHKLLNEYSILHNNWDEDDAIAPNEKVIQNAKSITTLLERHSQPIFHVAPGPNGEIMLDIRNTKKTKSLEIIFHPNRSIVVFFPEHGKPTQQIFDNSQLPDYLEWLNQ